MGGLPENMNFELLEPLRELFKDEVRRIGVELGLPRGDGLPPSVPGPGLGVRILGEVKRECADLLRRADAIFIEELRKARRLWYDETGQAFAVFLPVKSVGVMGDGRALRLRRWRCAPCETIDFMTALGAPAVWGCWKPSRNRIINEIGSVSQVTYDVSSSHRPRSIGSSSELVR